MLMAVACAPADDASESPPVDQAATGPPASLSWETVQDPSHRVAVVEGLSGPEAVRYDPELDVYWVSNMNGDDPGFIARVSTDGDVEVREFMTGTDEFPLVDPRGMNVTGDTLWVADADGIHGFQRTSGEQVAFVDFTGFEPGFLNDIAVGPDGALYVTDTGAARVYRLAGREAAVAIEDDRLGPPNGIAWDATGERFLLAPWGGEQTFHAWRPGSDPEPFATSPGGNFDGIEIVGDRVLVASQSDTSIHVIEDGAGRAFIITGGRPADIAVDTRRVRVAVPYISLNRVDIWQLPLQ